MKHNRLARKLFISLIAMSLSLGLGGIASAARPNPGSTARDSSSSFQHPNPGSTIRDPGPRPGPGIQRPDPGSAYNHPARPQGPNIPVPSVTVHNPPAPGQTSYSNHPGSPGQPYYQHGPYVNRPAGNRPYINRPYWGHGPQRPPYMGYSPYRYWPRSGIVFHFGWSRPYYWWGCRRGISFGEYLLLALMVGSIRSSESCNIDNLYSEHLNGVSYDELCRRYNLDYPSLEASARVRYSEMSVYAHNQGIAFWTWDDRLVY